MKRKFIGSFDVRFNRNVQKSIRMDDSIYEYIMAFYGSNFSDKLENLVVDHAKLTDHLKDIRNYFGPG